MVRHGRCQKKTDVVRKRHQRSNVYLGYRYLRNRKKYLLAQIQNYSMVIIRVFLCYGLSRWFSVNLCMYLKILVQCNPDLAKHYLVDKKNQ